MSNLLPLQYEGHYRNNPLPDLAQCKNCNFVSRWQDFYNRGWEHVDRYTVYEQLRCPKCASKAILQVIEPTEEGK